MKSVACLGFQILSTQLCLRKITFLVLLLLDFVLTSIKYYSVNICSIAETASSHLNEIYACSSNMHPVNIALYW